MAATMSTSMPTKLPEASVYSKGLKTVSVAMTQVLSEPAVSAVAVSEVEASEEVLSLVEAAPPQAARDSAIMAAIPNASSFFIVFSFLSIQIARPAAARMPG